jgi:hypothetical protein
MNDLLPVAAPREVPWPKDVVRVAGPRQPAGLRPRPCGGSRIGTWMMRGMPSAGPLT